MMYGVDWNAPITMEREGSSRVEVPSNYFHLPDDVNLELQELFNPLAESDQFGVEIYINLCEYLSSVL